MELQNYSNYSEEIQKILKMNKIEIGIRVKIIKENKKFEGLLMPRPETGNNSILIIKRDDGYNIGIKYGKGTVIEKSSYREPDAVKEEEEFELGKVKKSLLKLEFDRKKPPISLVSTGGTIASRINYVTGGVRSLEDPREFLHNVPELADFVNIKKISSTLSKMSEEMEPNDWQEIAKYIVKELNSESRGVIITVGTDALHYIAAALSFFLRNLNKPVALVGAQRSSDRGSSDAGMNLLCAAHVAKSGIAEVGSCLHGSINDDFCFFIRGTKARKMHSSRRDAFRAINEKPIAKVFPGGKIEAMNTYRKRSGGEVELDSKFENKVALIKTYPGSDPSVLDFYLEKGFRGFVLEGMGLGHVPLNNKNSWIDPIKRLSQDGIPVIITSQTIYGRVNPHVYSNLRILFNHANAIPGEDMLSETAYVKLGWVLGHTRDIQDVKKQMLTNFRGEINQRISPESFLY